MKTLTAVFSLFVMLFPATIHAETVIKAESSVSSATVYPDRALVVRTAKVKLATGGYRIVFSGLPGEVMPDSIRVKGAGTARVRLGAVDVRQTRTTGCPMSRTSPKSKETFIRRYSSTTPRSGLRR